MPSPRSVVLVCTVLLLVAWVAVHLRVLFASQNGLIRFVLTGLFSLLIILRRKPSAAGQAPSEERVTRVPSARRSLAIGIAATLVAVSGMILPVGQMEWLGLLLLVFACLKWSLPDKYSKDIALALLLLYWAHPLPSRVFGPMELSMQKLSVNGTEWLLYGLDVRVWADGLVLRTGFNTYEVPAWCSGMRTATTVFLLALGLGILKRFRMIECLLIVVAALAQGLILNILRIAAMVVLSPQLKDTSALEFLHNSTGIVVTLAVFLVYLEIRFYERRKQDKALTEQELTPTELRRRTDRPHVWNTIRRCGVAWVLVVLSVITVLWLVYCHRRGHRLQVIREIAVCARNAGNLADAQLAAGEALALDPYDNGWKLTVCRILLLSRKYDDVLALLKDISDENGTRTVEKNVLEAYALMALDRMDEAAVIVTTLPDSVKHNNPRVAMILAEMAFHANEPEAVARSVVIAARWPPNTDRIRELYPFLRTHRKWSAIVESDTRAPFLRSSPAFSAIEAYMNLNSAPDVARMLLRASVFWPGDSRILEPLFFMAIRRVDGEWETRFDEHLVRCVNRISDVDYLYGMFDKCFQLARPDLAWVVHRRIQAVDASHPGLLMSAVRYGDVWFSFRRRRLGLSSPSVDDRIDLKPLYRIGQALNSWHALCEEVPLGDELAVYNTIAVRRSLLTRALEEFRKRDEPTQSGDMPAGAAESRLSLMMRYAYAEALEMAGDLDGASSELEGIAADNVREEDRVRIKRSEIFERQADWQRVYEILRGYAEVESPGLDAILRLSEACDKLQLSIASLYAAREAHRQFPNSSRALGVLAGRLIESNAPEDALHLLGRPRTRHQRKIDMLEARALFKTGRFSETRSFCRSVLLPRPTKSGEIAQGLVLSPAELTTLWHHVFTPGPDGYARHAEILRRNLAGATSPFLQDMIRLWLQCYENGCEGASADIDLWTACGRDRIEKATALNQLTLLLLNSERPADARSAAGRAVEFFPECPKLWHVFISLTNADSDVIAEARRSCPEDSEIWLASIVAGTSRSPVDEWALDEVTRAVGSGTVTAAAMTRASEYLLRKGFKEAAVVAARDATSRARGLLPAYVQGIRCALTERDKDWALSSTEKAIDASQHPIPAFYRKLVDLKSSHEPIDTDFEMVSALKHLRRDDPDNIRWAQMLGYVRFKRGGWEIVDALAQMTVAIQGGATNSMPYIIAAEAARLLDNHDRSVAILRRGLELCPESPAMLNNLIYSLSLLPDHAEESVALLPSLMERGGDNPRFQDTAAAVYLRAGYYKKARESVSRVLEKSEVGSVLWFRSHVRLAELARAAGDIDLAITTLESAMTAVSATVDEDLTNANRLLSQWRSAPRDRERTQGPEPEEQSP